MLSAVRSTYGRKPYCCVAMETEGSKQFPVAQLVDWLAVQYGVFGINGRVIGGLETTGNGQL